MATPQEPELQPAAVVLQKNFVPIALNERIGAMDILRGLALVGILLMNIEWFNRAISGLGSQDTSLTGLDHAVGWLIRCFVEGKFYTLFSLLFGMGFAVMLVRAKAAERPFSAWFFRRMLILIAFGVLHMIFLWGGDILHSYGFAGLLLLAWLTLVKKSSFTHYDNPKSMFKLAMVWLLIPVFISIVSGISFGISHDTSELTTTWYEEIKVAERVKAINSASDTPSQQAMDALITNDTKLPISKVRSDNDDATDEPFSLLEENVIEQLAEEIVNQQQVIKSDELEEISALSQASYWQATEFRIDFAWYMLMLAAPFAFFMLMPLFLLGYWLVSSGIMKNYRQYRNVFKLLACFGIGLGVVLETGGLLVVQHPVANQVMLLQAVGEGLFYIGQLVMSAGYFGLVMYLLADEKWHRRLSVFAPMGRMALTNYIMQSVILSSIFYGYAGGYYGEIARAPQMLIVLVIVIAQLLLSRWWLKSYAFGPLEWLWRCLSYKKLQTMRIQ